MGPTDRLPGLHALRCLAAVMVFILHVVFLSTNYVQPVFDFVTPYFALGVQLFYVVSAFALMHSTRLYAHRPDWLRSFYLKRVFRIAPLWYVVLAWTVIHRHLATDNPPGAFEILLNATFVNNLVPFYSLSIVFAGWSIGVEMLFYLIFPLVFVLVRSLGAGLVFLALSLLIGEFALRYFADTPTQVFPYAEFSFPANLRFFAFGVVAFLVWEKLAPTAWARVDASPVRAIGFHLLLGGATLGILALILATEDDLRPLYRVDVVLWGLLFATMTVWFSVRPFSVLSWAPIQYLGERSYSLYLWHVLLIIYLIQPSRDVFDALAPAMGGWAIFPAILTSWIPVVIVSSLTYRLIERPGMALGKRIDKWLRGGATVQQPV